jgi:hypothetical protein
MAFSTKECAWSQTTVTLLGRKLVGIRGFEYKKSVEKEVIYGAGQHGIDITEGNIKVEGSIKLLKYELDLLNDAAQKANYNDITEVPHVAILATVDYKKDATSKMQTDSIIGMSFTEMPKGMEQGAKMMEVTLPFIALKVKPV